MSFRRRLCMILPALALASAGLLLAAGEGRMIGTVVDGDGNPVEGVKVTVTSPDLSTFRASASTKKNGSFVVAFADAYLKYLYKFEKQGFQTREVEFKTSSSGAVRETFTIYAGVDTAAGLATQEVVSASNDAVMAFNAGLAAFQAKDKATAETKLLEALAVDPEMTQAHLLLAEVYMEKRQYREAATSAESALAKEPTNTDGLRLRYQAYRELGDKTKAEEAFAAFKAAGEAAEEAKRVYNEGVALDRAGDAAGAYQKFLQAGELDPGLALVQTALMATAYKTKNYDEAAKAAERLLAADATNAQALRVRFDSYVALGNADKRLEALLGLATVDPDFALGTLLEEGAAKFNGNDYKGSKPIFEKILEVDPKRAKVYYFLGLIAVNDGDNATAKRHLAKFVELDPNDADASTAKEMINFL